jgi:6-phosphogluconolactonase
MKTTLYVGTYTLPIDETQRNWNFAQGIALFELDEETGALAQSGLIPGIANPSYLCRSRDGKRLYCVNEINDYNHLESGAITVLSLEDANRFAVLAQVPSHGKSPCHIALSAREDLLYVANYGSGSVCAYALDGAGLPTQSAVVQHSGNGPRADRQEAPHLHSTALCGDGILACDLGTDTLYLYDTGKTSTGALSLTERARLPVAPASGPRLCVFHPRLPVCYTINELSSDIQVFALADGIPHQLEQTISTLPETRAPDVAVSAGENTAADIHIDCDGVYLYASNRGYDSICVYAIDGHSGHLSPVQQVSSGGKTPRAFALSPSGAWLIAANQHSGLALFRVERTTGCLTLRGTHDFPSPVCVIS